MLQCPLRSFDNIVYPFIRYPFAKQVCHTAYEDVARLLPACGFVEAVAVEGRREIERIWLVFSAIKSNAPHRFIKHRVIRKYRHQV